MRILTLPADEAILRTPSEPVEAGVDWKEVVTALWETLTNSKERGVGLSAIQIGIPLRIFVTLLRGQHQIYLNPTITRTDGPIVAGPEGCLSLPGVTRSVGRWSRILLQPLAFQPFPKSLILLEGYEARVVQHEMDHLDGRLLTDKEECHFPQEGVL